MLEVEDPADIDPTRTSGITDAAEDRLYEALPDLGFAIDSINGKKS